MQYILGQYGRTHYICLTMFDGIVVFAYHFQGKIPHGGLYRETQESAQTRLDQWLAAVNWKSSHANTLAQMYLSTIRGVAPTGRTTSKTCRSTLRLEAIRKRSTNIEHTPKSPARPGTRLQKHLAGNIAQSRCRVFGRLSTQPSRKLPKQPASRQANPYSRQRMLGLLWLISLRDYADLISTADWVYS